MISNLRFNPVEVASKSVFPRDESNALKLIDTIGKDNNYFNPV
jgi:hypothetical protein